MADDSVILTRVKKTAIGQAASRVLPSDLRDRAHAIVRIFAAVMRERLRLIFDD